VLHRGERQTTAHLLVPVGTPASGQRTLVAHVIDRLVMSLRLKDAREGGAGI
jgi:hypothetical protein